jgi:hypothetical protein
MKYNIRIPQKKGEIQEKFLSISPCLAVKKAG